MPQPGQTVTWTTANSPYRACESLTIPAGGTVDVQPGVRIDFDCGMQRVVVGTLNINASAAAHVVLTAPDSFPPFLLVSGGTVKRT